jgi:nitroreductase
VFNATVDRVAESPAGALRPHAPTITDGIVAVDDLRVLAVNRRSVRWFTGEPVPHEVIRQALEVGLQAPTACNRQPYRVVVIDDPAKVLEVGSIPMGTKGYVHQIPTLMVVVGDLSAFASARDRHLIYIDASLAIMGIIFGLEAQGVASCCINWPDMEDREARIKESLGLEAHERVIMMLAAGFANPDGLAPYSARKPDELLFQFWSAADDERP